MRLALMGLIGPFQERSIPRKAKLLTWWRHVNPAFVASASVHHSNITSVTASSTFVLSDLSLFWLPLLRNKQPTLTVTRQGLYYIHWLCGSRIQVGHGLCLTHHVWGLRGGSFKYVRAEVF